MGKSRDPSIYALISACPHNFKPDQKQQNRRGEALINRGSQSSVSSVHSEPCLCSGFCVPPKTGQKLYRRPTLRTERNLTLLDYSEMATESSELVESHADAPARENDFTWTCGDGNTKHIKKINHGAFGDVHMVALSKAPS
jgi:hypothetical protein